MKSWNYWVPRVLAGVVAVVLLGMTVPWDGVEKYLFVPVSNLRNFSILWLVGAHCMTHRRARWLGWATLAGALAILLLTIVSNVIEGSVASGPPIPVLHTIRYRLEWLVFTLAIVLLLLFPRLKGARRKIQFLTAIAIVADLISYEVYYWMPRGLPHSVYHGMWITHGCIGLLAYLGVFVTTYYAVVYHEPLQGYVPTGDGADRVKLGCPRCSKPQDLPLGRSVCTDCGMGIHIEIEDTKCLKCGYTLRGLTQPMCPECGTGFGVPAAGVGLIRS
jgi:hypothetical protein